MKPLKYKKLELTERQAFYLWSIANSAKAPKGIMGRLFNFFGGTESKFYKKWANSETV